MMLPKVSVRSNTRCWQQTEPLVAFYRERGKLAVIPFCPSIEETTAEVMKALEA